MHGIKNRIMNYEHRVSHLDFFKNSLLDYHQYNSNEKNHFKAQSLYFLNYNELYCLKDNIDLLSDNPSKLDMLNWWNLTSTQYEITEKFKKEIKIKFEEDFNRANSCLDNFNLIIFCISKLFEFQGLSNRNEYESIIFNLNFEIIRLRTEIYSDVKSSPVLSASQSLSMFLIESKGKAINVFKKILIEERNRKNDGYKTMYLMPLIESVKSKLKIDYLPYIELPSDNEERVLKFKKNIEFQVLENITFPLGFPFRKAKIISKTNILDKTVITSKDDFIKTHFLFFKLENVESFEKLKIDRNVIEDFYTIITEYYPTEVDIIRLNKSRMKLCEYFNLTEGSSKQFLIFTRFLIEETQIIQLLEIGSAKKLCNLYSEYFYDVFDFKIDKIKSHIIRTEFHEKYIVNFKNKPIFKELKPYSHYGITQV